VRKKETRQNFLQGALILALANAFVKVIGAIYKIPLGNMLDGEGMGHFGVAYSIYGVLLTISTAGLPVALSRMIAEARASNREYEINRIFKVARLTFVIIGTVGASFMLVFAKLLANMLGDSLAWRSIMALAPAVFFISVVSAYRGLFQGNSNMIPTSVSQVIEALGKLVIGLGVAGLMLSAGMGEDWASAGAIIGVTTGTALSLLYLMIKKSKTELVTAESGIARSNKQIFKTLMSIGIPITIGASVLSLTNLIDTALVMTRLQASAGFTEEQATALYGSYFNVQTLFNLPSSFITPLTVSIIPAITAAIVLKDKVKTNQTIESALRITSLIAMPAGVGLLVLSQPILNLLYPSKPTLVIEGAPLLSILGIAVIVNCIVLLTNSILQASGKVNIPIITMLVGGVIKIISNWILVGNPNINIMGAPIGTCLCYGTIAVLNMIFVVRITKISYKIVLVLIKPLLCAVIMGGAVWASFGFFDRVIGGNKATLIALAIAVMVYFGLVILTKAITKEDIKEIIG